MCRLILRGKNCCNFPPDGRSAVNTKRQDATTAAKEKESEVSASMDDGTIKRATEYRSMTVHRHDHSRRTLMCVLLWDSETLLSKIENRLEKSFGCGRKKDVELFSSEHRHEL